ncbi:hypothetical protein TNCV_3366831 [Trichonephila clavipes]|nr:hypothetical protein TNCV_3366831 [Trichonephila clavipes]
MWGIIDNCLNGRPLIRHQPASTRRLPAVFIDTGCLEGGDNNVPSVHSAHPVHQTSQALPGTAHFINRRDSTLSDLLLYERDKAKGEFFVALLRRYLMLFLRSTSPPEKCMCNIMWRIVNVILLKSSKFLQQLRYKSGEINYDEFEWN